MAPRIPLPEHCQLCGTLMRYEVARCVYVCTDRRCRHEITGSALETSLLSTTAWEPGELDGKLSGPLFDGLTDAA